MTKNFPELIKDINPQILESWFLNKRKKFKLYLDTWWWQCRTPKTKQRKKDRENCEA